MTKLHRLYRHKLAAVIDYDPYVVIDAGIPGWSFTHGSGLNRGNGIKSSDGYMILAPQNISLCYDKNADDSLRIIGPDGKLITSISGKNFNDDLDVFRAAIVVVEQHRTQSKTASSKDKKTVSSIAAYNSDGKLLFGLRNDDEKWTLPGGHSEEGEDPRDTAVRELKEETGLDAGELEYLGSGYGGKDNSIIVFCYKTTVDGSPTSDDDPDAECSVWSWVDVSNGVPDSIMDHLHSKKNITLGLLDLQKKAAINVVDDIDEVVNNKQLSKPSEYPAGEEIHNPALVDNIRAIEPRTAGGFGNSLCELTQTSVPTSQNDGHMPYHDENRSEDVDVKLGDVEEPYGDGLGPIAVDPDADKKFNITRGAGADDLDFGMMDVYTNLKPRLFKDQFGTIYSTPTDAYKTLGISTTIVKKILDGKIPSAKGFTFTYLDENDPVAQMIDEPQTGLGDEPIDELHLVGPGVPRGANRTATVGNIVRLVGFPRELAERINARFPRADVAAAKAIKAFSDKYHVELVHAVNMWVDSSANNNYVVALFDKGDVKFIKHLNSSNMDWDSIRTLAEEMSVRQSQLTVNDAILIFPDGFYWVPVSGDECKIEGKMMQHCGLPTAQMYSLRDQNDKPHVTIDVENQTLMQCRGKQNVIPDRRYWDYIKAFTDELGLHSVFTYTRYSTDEVADYCELTYVDGDGVPWEDDVGADNDEGMTNLRAQPAHDDLEVEAVALSDSPVNENRYEDDSFRQDQSIPLHRW
jgi:8-oxo-dGTP pyrophosphatase MutT (NUDIX family)